jgi:hypothetical protein
MVRKTRRRSSKKEKGVFSIPELRRSFEHIESFVDSKIVSKEPKDKIVKELRKEWSNVFLKDLDKDSAEAFVEDRMSKKHSNSHRKTIRRGGGPLAGAPIDYTTRQGIYLAPGQIPDKAGHLPLSDGGKSTFGSYVEYVSKGFWNPEPGQSYDPVTGQTRFPTSTPVGMGSNTVHFSANGGRRKTSHGRRKTRRGGSMAGSLISQAFTRPISSSSPPGILQDMQSMWYGQRVGPSPDQVQRSIY